jgi:type IX secretion system PorP/SprF family membrane protein
MTQYLPKMFNSVKKILAVMVCLFAAYAVKAQDPEFTQFYAAPVYTNPAMAGTAVCDGNGKQAGGRMVLNYRNQWPSLPGTFRTFAASFDQHVDGINGGVGLIAMRDIAGDGLLTTTSVSGIYSYQALFGGHSKKRFALRMAIQAGLMQRSIDFNKLRFSDQILPKKGFVNPTQETLPNNSVSFPNFSAGMLLYSGSFYAGFAVHNINEPNQSFFKNTDSGTTLPRRFTVHAGTVIPLKKTKKNQEPEMTISPNILIMTQQKFFQTNIGFYLNKGPFVAGLWFRQTAPNSDALIALVGFRYQKFKFGYSYDITVSSARSAAPGSHEISASVEWCVKSSGRWKRLVCPSF